ncbi:MAG: type II CAAX endopeptidase family protein, partial [Planctomycetota bacterium]
ARYQKSLETSSLGEIDKTGQTAQEQGDETGRLSKRHDKLQDRKAIDEQPTQAKDAKNKKKNSDDSFTLDEVFKGSHERRSRILSSLGTLLLLVVACKLLFHLGNGNQDLGQVEWSLQWLFTFPARARVLFLSKLAEEVVGSVFGWIFFLPFFFILYLSAGYGGWSVLLAAGATFYINLITGSIVLLAETTLRKRFNRAKLKNIQALATVLSSIVMLSLVALGIAESGPKLLLSLTLHIPMLVHWQPFSIPVLLCAMGSTALVCAGLMVIFGALFSAGSLLLAQRCVKTGLITESGAYQGSRTRVESGKVTRTCWFRGVVAKDLLLLMRDRNLLVQTLLPPFVFIGYQFMANPKLFNAIQAQFDHAAAIAFGLGAYTLVFCSVTVLTVEGKACWMLFASPEPIENIILKKALMWGIYASAFPLIVLIWAFWHFPNIGFSEVLNAFMAMAGIVIYSVVGACLGALGTNLYEQNLKRKIRQSVTLLFMFLAGFYTYGIYATEVWSKLGMLVLCALLAYAMWQKVRDQAPFLLDPDVVPPPRLSLSDGLIFAMLFFVIQGILFAIFTKKEALPSGVGLICSFGVAGAVTTIFSYILFSARGISDLEETLGFVSDIKLRKYSQSRALVEGVVFGLGAMVVGLAYLWGIEHAEWLSHMKKTMPSLGVVPDDFKIGFAVIAILLAPVFEEYIFRALIYRGLRRTLRVELSVIASAAIFAVVHPPGSMIPVFFLGVAAAISFERTRLLHAPVVTHLVYNAGILFISF